MLEEAFAPPPSPEQLGPTAFGFEGEPSAFVKDVLQRLRATDSQAKVDSRKCCIEIHFFDNLFRYCGAKVRIYTTRWGHCAHIARVRGDTFAYARLLHIIEGVGEAHVPEPPVLWHEADLQIALDMLGAKESRLEALSMLLRYKVFDERLLQFALDLLREPLEVAFLAARLLREMALRGLVCASAAPIVSRALIGAGPLVARELVSCLRALGD